MTAAFTHGMSVSDILAVADWSSDNTFRKFYFRPDMARKKSLTQAFVQNNVIYDTILYAYDKSWK